MSEVWNHFKMGSGGLSVTCNHCNKFMKRSDSSTKSMWGHLKAWHIDLVGEQTFRLKRIRRVRGEGSSSHKKTTSRRKGNNKSNEFYSKSSESDYGNNDGERRSTSLSSDSTSSAMSLGPTNKNPPFSLLSIESLLADNRNKTSSSENFYNLFPPAKDTKKNFNSSEKEPSAMLPPNNACVFAQPKFGEPFDRSQEDMNAPKAMAPNIQPSAALMSASHQAFPFLDQSQQLAAQLILLAKAEMLQPPIDSALGISSLMGWMTDWNKLDGGLALPSFAGEASELGDFSSLMNSFAAASQLGGLGASMPNNFNNFQQQQQYPQAALNIAANAINGCSAFTPNTAAGHSLNNVSSRTLTPKCVVEAEPNKAKIPSRKRSAPAEKSPLNNENFSSSDFSPLFVLADTATSAANVDTRQASSSSSSTILSDNRTGTKDPPSNNNDECSSNRAGFSILDSINVHELQKISTDFDVCYSVKGLKGSIFVEFSKDDPSGHQSTPTTANHNHHPMMLSLIIDPGQQQVRVVRKYGELLTVEDLQLHQQFRHDHQNLVRKLVHTFFILGELKNAK